MSKENKKRCLRSFVGKGHRHLVTAVCDDKQMTVVVASAKGATTYFLRCESVVFSGKSFIKREDPDRKLDRKGSKQ